MIFDDRPAQPATWYGTKGEWNAWVEAGGDEQERSRRLALAPESMRPGIESHVSTALHESLKRDVTQWVEYVMRARSREGRNDRLAEAPADYQRDVEDRVRREFWKRRGSDGASRDQDG